MNNVAKLFVILWSVLVSNQLHAITINDSAELHGFVSQSYVYSPDNPYAGTDAENGSLNFREVGLNGFWEFDSHFRVAGQVLSRKVDEASDGAVKIDFLLADYLVVSDAAATFGVRFGRIKNQFGIYNTSRDIPNSRPGITVPSAVYFESLRDIALTSDGVDLYGSFSSDVGLFSWDAYAGRRDIDGPAIEHYLVGTDVEGQFDEVTSKGLKLNFIPNSSHDLNFGLSVLHILTELKDAQSTLDAQTAAFIANPANPFAAITNNFRPYLTGIELDALYALASVQYGYKDWLFTAEYLNIFVDMDLEIAGSPDNVSVTSEGFYLQAEWFANESIQTMIRYNQLYLIDNDRQGIRNATVNNPYHGYGTGVTFGIKWLIDSDWTLAGQVSLNEGTVWLPVYEGIEQEALQENWNAYGLQLSYKF
ncbi:hypothetical protein [Thiomicrorhabdus lithotrophica]|uniref:Uncharacterized protein n=1 Tax=Thiomicrorhabdus lithotrophica TaxID=2949997 RepID=A0ABY8C8J3_9GAMM|nr:hypothetical protein [Thiomicrorhabdus lithotrophica]WEJ62291.1 hypothetical protein NR989_09750 [Thiomicrorhabdus lithotrophica]